MNNQSLNLLDLVVPSTTADTNIHTFMEFKDWINSSFTLQTQLNPPSYITKNTEVRSLRVRKGKSLAYENAERPFNKITTSLTKKLSIAYNDQLNQIEERGENLEHSAMDESKNNGILRKQSFGGELGFDLLRQTSLRRSHSAQSSISVNGFEQINQYQLVKLLGRGAFADVYLAIDVESPTKKEYAVKILCSKKIKKRLHLRKSSMMLQGPPSPPPDLQEQSPIPIEKKSDSKSKKSKHTLADLFVRNQVAILKKMNHRYITKLYDVIIDNVKQKVYLVLQYCSGGFIGYHRDKDNEIEWKTPYRKLLESECKRYTKQMALALDYIHNVAKIAHRDIKPENILLSELDEIKISDFGLGTHKLKGQKYAGTPLFMPPEAQLNPDQKTNEDVKEQGDAKAGDIWALGVTLLVLLSGRHPQFSSNKIDVEYEISKIKKDISEPCKNFIQKCLQRDASKRIKAEQLMGHKWLGGQVIKHVKESEAIVVTLSEQENVISLRKGPEELREKGEKIEFKENESEKLFNQFGEEVGQSYTTSFPPTSFKIMIDQ